MRRAIPLLMLSLAIPACRQAAAPPATIPAAQDKSYDGLLGLIRDRLEVMHDVARWKWSKKSPIEDPGREAALLEDVADEGIALGLDPEVTRAFFRGQIEAAKLVQRSHFRRWEAGGRGLEGETPDLAGDLRPRIDRLNRGLLAALDAARFRLLDREAGASLRERADQMSVGEGIDAGVRDAAIGPLVNSIR